MSELHEPLYQELGDGLVLRTARSEEDIRRVGQSHKESFGEHDPNLDVITENLLRKYPGVEGRDCLLVEDTGTGKVVSSICLIPMEWMYEDVTLTVGELGIVGTNPDYRRRGLIRQQMKVFENKLNERGCHIGVIEGIPYFYRQFGYEYALRLFGGYQLNLDRIPDLAEGEQEAATIRRMTEADMPQALAFYEASTRHLCLRMKRTAANWKYEDELPEANSSHAESFMVEAGGQTVGYFRAGRHPWDNEMWLCKEMSDLTYWQILAVLRWLKETAQEKACKRVAVELHESAPALDVARRLRGEVRQPYGWQIHIPHYERFFQAIAPVLERRIAGSMLAGLTQTLDINFYDDTIQLVFQQGRLEKVASLGRTYPKDIRLPPEPATQLLLGYRSREEIRSYRLDFGVDGKYQLAIDTLFPKRESYVYRVI